MAVDSCGSFLQLSQTSRTLFRSVSKTRIEYCELASAGMACPLMSESVDVANRMVLETLWQLSRGAEPL